MRRLRSKVGKDNICFVHVSLVPIVGSTDDGEQKSKPTQMSLRELNARGIFPDIVACRSKVVLSESVRRKIAEFGNVDIEGVISVPDVSNIYRVPLLLHSQGYTNHVLNVLGLESPYLFFLN